MWNVATTGGWEKPLKNTLCEMLGISGSCTWMMSKWPCRTQLRTVFPTKPKYEIWATDPLYGKANDVLVVCTHNGISLVRRPGARTDTECPRDIISSAKSFTCACTPPGASKEYGQIIPMRRGCAVGSSSLRECSSRKRLPSTISVPPSFSDISGAVILHNRTGIKFTSAGPYQGPQGK